MIEHDAGYFLAARRCPNGRPVASFDSRSLDVAIEPDPVTGSAQWFHFRAFAREAVPIRIVNAAASSYPRGWSESIVWARHGSRRWTPVAASYADGMLSFSHVAPRATASYALFPPFPFSRLARLAANVAASSLGSSTVAVPEAGAACHLALGDPDPAARQIWIVCGQHGNEHPAIWFADGFVAALLERGSLPAGKRFHIVPVANPAGMKAGHLRTNSDGQDPNRHWGVSDSPQCPEVRTLLDAMEATGVGLLVDIHTDFEMACVYLDVLEEWLETSPALVAVREAFERGLADRSPDVSFGRRYPWETPPRAEQLAGMCAPAIERRFGAAAITLELPIGRYRDGDDRPGIWTPRKSRALGRVAAEILLAES